MTNIKYDFTITIFFYIFILVGSKYGGKPKITFLHGERKKEERQKRVIKVCVNNGTTGGVCKPSGSKLVLQNTEQISISLEFVCILVHSGHNGFRGMTFHLLGAYSLVTEHRGFCIEPILRASSDVQSLIDDSQKHSEEKNIKI